MPALAIVTGAATLSTSRGAIVRALLKLGDASYAIYLTHGFVMIAYARLIKKGQMPLPGWEAILLVVLLGIAVGYAAHVLVERPISHYIKGVLSRGDDLKRLLALRSPADSPRGSQS